MKDWMLWALGAGLAYYLYQNSLATVATTVTGYVPMSNASGNEFSCPTGTTYHDEGIQTSGSGYCT